MKLKAENPTNKQQVNAAAEKVLANHLKGGRLAFGDIHGLQTVIDCKGFSFFAILKIFLYLQLYYSLQLRLNLWNWRNYV